MELSIELLEAKRAKCLQAIKQAEADLNANYGALQAVEELLAIARAPESAKSNKKE